MEIEIIKNDNGNLLAVHKNTFRALFEFVYRREEYLGGPAWYFWLRGNFRPDIFNGEKAEFPMEFFKDACRALFFIQKGEGLHEDVEIVSGEELLTD